MRTCSNLVSVFSNSLWMVYLEMMARMMDPIMTPHCDQSSGPSMYDQRVSLICSKFSMHLF